MKNTYSYRCNKCGLEFEETLSEENKLEPCKQLQPEQCDVYVAPHFGVAECDVVLV